MFILVGLATLMGSSRFILVGLATLSGSSRLTLFYSTLLALTDGRTDRETTTLASRGLDSGGKPLRTDRRTKGGTNTLASRELEEPAHASRGLEDLFLQLCSFWFWREIGFGFTYYLCT